MRTLLSRSPIGWLLAASVALAAAAWEGPAAHADGAPNLVVARVGKMTITAADVERRMSSMPPFQLRSFGSTPEEIRRNFVERVLVREALLAQGATDRGLENRDDVKERIRSVLESVMVAHVREEAGRTIKISDEDVKAYYDKNASKFHSPALLAIWQIVVRTKEEANAILADLKKDPSPRHWNDLAREKSIDKTSSMRGGDMGFARPDGTTNEPGLHVSRAVLEAAERAKDSEILSTPVHDGDQWVIVWRRQAIKAVDQPVETQAPQIRHVLLHERVEAKVKETIADLRRRNVTDFDPHLLDEFDVSGQGDFAATRRPGTLSSARHPAANPVPNPATQR